VAEEKVEKKGVSKSEKLFAGIVLTIIGLLGLGYGGVGMGGMMYMMGRYGYGYYPSYYYPISIIVTLVSLGVILFGLYLIYDSVRG
jgi:hypothetical protein